MHKIKPPEHIDELRTSAELPIPKGWKILIAMPKMERVSEGGVHLADEAVDREEIASMFGLVIELGPDAYKDERKFPSGPYCKVGDWVVFRSYSGTKLRIKNYEFRLINDDTVEAVVHDPREYKRAY